MSKIYSILVILMLSGQASFLFAQETPVSDVGGEVLPLSSGTYSGLVETAYDDPDWVLVLSEVILRENLCSDPWYEKVFEPCYWTGDTPKYNRYWALELCSEPGQAFPLAEISNPYWPDA